MILLIDGYNILKKIKKTAYITDAERKNFIKQLHNYAHKKELKLVVVFDGGPFQWPSHEKISSVMEVVYSGAQETADDYIKKYFDLHKNEDILLISSDRELVTYARQYSVPSLDSYEFAQLLFSMANVTPSKKMPQQKSEKLTKTHHKELDLLMEQLSVAHVKKDADYEEPRVKKQQLSKEERKILKKIKKL